MDIIIHIKIDTYPTTEEQMIMATKCGLSMVVGWDKGLTESLIEDKTK